MYKIHLLLIGFLLISSCSNVPSTRWIASDTHNYLTKIDGNENLTQPMKLMLGDEQNLHVKNLWRAGAFSSDIAPEYVPEANPKFPLAYYLVPADDAKFLSTSSLDPNVLSQISSVGDDGKRYYKLFVHPESEEHYSFLNGVYKYVGQDATEFLASPTSSYRSLVIWNESDINLKPFIGKVSLDRKVIGNIDRLVSINEIERSLANQNAFEKIGDQILDRLNVKIFPETAGLVIEKNHSGAPSKLGGQLIREIPDDIFKGGKRWVAWATLMSPERGQGRPALIMDVIKKSGLSSESFVKKFMIDGYMDMFERLSLEMGMNFEPHSQNLGFEILDDFTPTGKWIIKDFGGVWPDVLTMLKEKGPYNVYMDNNSATKYKLVGGRSNAISSYVFFYKRQVFDFLMNEIKKYDPDFTEKTIQKLQSSIDKRFVKMINKYFSLHETKAPQMDNYKRIQNKISENTPFSYSKEYKEINDRELIKKYVYKKKENGEWVNLKITTKQSTFFISPNGIFQVAEGNIISFGLFTKEEAKAFSTWGPRLDMIVKSTDPSFINCYDLLKPLQASFPGM